MSQRTKWFFYANNANLLGFTYKGYNAYFGNLQPSGEHTDYNERNVPSNLHAVCDPDHNSECDAKTLTFNVTVQPENILHDVVVTYKNNGAKVGNTQTLTLTAATSRIDSSMLKLPSNYVLKNSSQTFDANTNTLDVDVTPAEQSVTVTYKSDGKPVGTQTVTVTQGVLHKNQLTDLPHHYQLPPNAPETWNVTGGGIEINVNKVSHDVTVHFKHATPTSVEEVGTQTLRDVPVGTTVAKTSLNAPSGYVIASSTPNNISANDDSVDVMVMKTVPWTMINSDTVKRYHDVTVHFKHHGSEVGKQVVAHLPVGDKINKSSLHAPSGYVFDSKTVADTIAAESNDVDVAVLKTVPYTMINYDTVTHYNNVKVNLKHGDDIVGTQNFRIKVGESINRKDLQIPKGYTLADNTPERIPVSKSGDIDVQLSQKRTVTFTFRDVSKKGDSVVGTQQIPDVDTLVKSIPAEKVQPPTGYGFNQQSQNVNITGDNTTVDVYPTTVYVKYVLEGQDGKNVGEVQKFDGVAPHTEFGKLKLKLPQGYVMQHYSAKSTSANPVKVNAPVKGTGLADDPYIVYVMNQTSVGEPLTRELADMSIDRKGADWKVGEPLTRTTADMSIDKNGVDWKLGDPLVRKLADITSDKSIVDFKKGDPLTRTMADMSIDKHLVDWKKGEPLVRSTADMSIDKNGVAWKVGDPLTRTMADMSIDKNGVKWEKGKPLTRELANMKTDKDIVKWGVGEPLVQKDKSKVVAKRAVKIPARHYLANTGVNIVMMLIATIVTVVLGVLFRTRAKHSK